MRAAAAALTAERAEVDDAQWTLWVRAHGPFLRRAMARLAGAATDDVVQEAFVSAFRRRGELPSDEGKLRGWLYRAAKHHWLHQLRSRAREARKREALAQEPATVVDDQRDAARLRAALATLPLRLREAFALVELEGLTAVAAASVIGIPENTVRSRLRRARELLVAELRHG